jgi:hypothetical protein
MAARLPPTATIRQYPRRGRRIEERRQDVLLRAGGSRPGARHRQPGELRRVEERARPALLVRRQRQRRLLSWRWPARAARQRGHRAHPGPGPGRAARGLSQQRRRRGDVRPGRRVAAHERLDGRPERSG